MPSRREEGQPKFTKLYKT